VIPAKLVSYIDVHVIVCLTDHRRDWPDAELATTLDDGQASFSERSCYHHALSGCRQLELYSQSRSVPQQHAPTRSCLQIGVLCFTCSYKLWLCLMCHSLLYIHPPAQCRPNPPLSGVLRVLAPERHSMQWMFLRVALFSTEWSVQVGTMSSNCAAWIV
jgi:hypothetical protein